jgi:hypothetical protein
MRVLQMRDLSSEGARIPLSAQHALTTCVAVVVLAGCSGATNVTPAPGNGLSSNSSRSLRATAYGSKPLKHEKHMEGLSGNGTGQGSCSVVNVNVQGKAKGPYPGTFTGNGLAFGHWCVGSHQIRFGGTFNVTSGTNAISGSFSSVYPAIGDCGGRQGGCSVGGKLTYTATIEPGGKTFSGQGQGGLSTSRDGNGTMNLIMGSWRVRHT